MTVTILIGDVREKLRAMADDSVNCVVTSPPYWGLRDYGIAGQLGLEPTLAEHLDVMVNQVFAEIRRVLRPDGTCWVNYGDCYASSVNGRKAAEVKALGNDDRTFRDKPFSTVQGTLKPKDLCMVPNRFAIAMQDAGWWVRSEIIWDKPNPMPESIKDRPGVAHEKVWLFTKSARYWYDHEAVRTEAKADSRGPGAGWVSGDSPHTALAHNRPKTNGVGWGHGTDKGERGRERVRADKQRGHSRRHAGFNECWDEMERAERMANGANLKNVWTISTKPFADAHFATFPPELPETCIKAGCPAGGMVLDPFGGAGTTGLVADALGRDCTMIELNPTYARLARRRIRQGLGRVISDLSDDRPDDLPLFTSDAGGFFHA